MNLAVYNNELQVGDLTSNEESQTKQKKHKKQETNERNAESCRAHKLVEHFF